MQKKLLILFALFCVLTAFLPVYGVNAAKVYIDEGFFSLAAARRFCMYIPPR